MHLPYLLGWLGCVVSWFSEAVLVMQKRGQAALPDLLGWLSCVVSWFSEAALVESGSSRRI